MLFADDVALCEAAAAACGALCSRAAQAELHEQRWNVTGCRRLAMHTAGRCLRQVNMNVMIHSGTTNSMRLQGVASSGIGASEVGLGRRRLVYVDGIKFRGKHGL